MGWPLELGASLEQRNSQMKPHEMHACTLELVPGSSIAGVGASERLVISALRLTASGRASCGGIQRVCDDMLGPNAPAVLEGLRSLAFLLPGESARVLTLGAPCARGLTWDEAGILGLLEAAQRSDVEGIGLWFRRLGIEAPSLPLQRAVAWMAAGLASSDHGFAPETAELAVNRRRPVADAG